MRQPNDPPCPMHQGAGIDLGQGSLAGPTTPALRPRDMTYDPRDAFPHDVRGDPHDPLSPPRRAGGGGANLPEPLKEYESQMPHMRGDYDRVDPNEPMRSQLQGLGAGIISPFGLNEHILRAFIEPHAGSPQKKILARWTADRLREMRRSWPAISGAGSGASSALMGRPWASSWKEVVRPGAASGRRRHLDRQHERG